MVQRSRPDTTDNFVAASLLVGAEPPAAEVVRQCRWIVVSAGRAGPGH